MIDEYLKVAGHEGLIRDSSTGAIVNTNRSEYEDYIQRKRLAEQREKILSEHTDEINNMKNELREIKDLLIRLVNK